MSLLRSLSDGLRSLFRKERVSQELDEELNGFLEMAAEEKMKHGMNRKDALRAVRLERGNLEVAKEVVRSAGWESLLETLWQDLRYGARMLRKNPGFTAVAVLTLALGIGANTAIFSIINGVLLKPLPYPEPDRLVTLWERSPQRGIEQESVSGPNYLDWRAQNSVLLEMAVSPGWQGSEEFNLVLGDSTIKVPGSYTSASLFSTLGTKPLLGRTFLPDEDRKDGNRVAVLGYGLWQRHFAGDSNVIGGTLTVDTYGRRDYRIVGVMPPGLGVPERCEL